jgi:hypothetical protein
MSASERVQLPEDLARGRSQFQAWRATRQTGSRIPQTLWALAVRFGYYPLPPWGGFAVLCGYTAFALGLASFLLRQRYA